jgi:hypothetical protein
MVTESCTDYLPLGFSANFDEQIKKTDKKRQNETAPTLVFFFN